MLSEGKRYVAAPCSSNRQRWLVGWMVFNATFNNIGVISWQSVLLVEETAAPRENHWPVASHWQIYHIMLYTLPCSGFKLTASVGIGKDCIGSCNAVIGKDCIGSCKSNYHTITATTAPTSKEDRHWLWIVGEFIINVNSFFLLGHSVFVIVKFL